MTGASKTGKAKRQLTRPIKTKRDFERAMSVTQRLLAHPNRDTEEEKRLKALLEEMDRFEDLEEDAGDDFSDSGDYGGPHRRWSDEGSND